MLLIQSYLKIVIIGHNLKFAFNSVIKDIAKKDMSVACSRC